MSGSVRIPSVSWRFAVRFMDPCKPSSLETARGDNEHLHVITIGWLAQKKRLELEK
jgi:hypothetical protein